MAAAFRKLSKDRHWDPKALRQARREIAALKPGEAWAADHPLTFEEFCALVDEDDRAELLDGVIYLSPAPFYEHEAVFKFLFTLLNNYVEAKRLGEVLGSRSAVRLDPYNAPQPDILFVRQRRRRIIKRLEITGPPDLVMEIAWSKSSRQRAMAKLTRYERFGVLEVWYIDLPRKLARLSHWDRRKKKHIASFEGNEGVIASQVVPGFAVRAEWLWSKPGKFPSPLAVAQELLAGRITK